VSRVQTLVNLQENELLIAKLSMTVAQLYKLQHIIGSAILKQLLSRNIVRSQTHRQSQFMSWLCVFALQPVQSSDLSLDPSTFI